MTATGDWLVQLRLTVRFRDCDPYGHVNNAVYLTYLENARFALWKAQGIRGVILARAEVDYRAQPSYGDQLEVRAKLDGFGRTSFRYVYEIVDVSTGNVVLEAQTVQVRYDYERNQPVPLSDEDKRKLSTHVGAVAWN
ncbi:MAG: acyl-CoA thioesterase [Vicinamibacterales bacterium]